jgi:hypothetical protein
MSANLSLAELQAELQDVDDKNPTRSANKAVIVVDEDERRYEVVSVEYWAGNAVLKIRAS